MPFVVSDPTPFSVAGYDPRSGAARPGGLESLIWVNGLVLNDQDAMEQYFVKSIEGLWGADIRDQREPRVNDDGEDVYDTLLGGKSVLINGRIDAHSLDAMRDMEQSLEQAFPHNYEYPIVFDRSKLRTEGFKRGLLNDSNQCLNPSFEANLVGYLTGSGNTLTRQTSFFTDKGNWAAEVAFVSGTSTFALEYDGTATATFGQYVQFGIDVFIPDTWTGGAPLITGLVMRPDGTYNANFITQIPELSDNAADLNIRNRWQRIWITYQWNDAINAGNVSLYVNIAAAAASGNTLRFDATSVRVFDAVESGLPVYFDGDSAGWKWDGAAHNSTSRPDPDAYRQDVFIMAQRIDKLGLRDEQTSQWFRREFQIPLRMSDPRIMSVKTKSVQSVVGQYTTLYPKNHGNYLAKPRLHIVGPWTNFSITSTTLMPGEDFQRKFSFTGSIPAGGYFDWDENTEDLIDNAGVNRNGMVDPSSTGLRLAPVATTTLTLGGTGLTTASQVFVYFEDTWK